MTEDTRPVLYVRISAELKANLAELARLSGLTLNTVVEQVLMRGLGSHWRAESSLHHLYRLLDDEEES